VFRHDGRGSRLGLLAAATAAALVIGACTGDDGGGGAGASDEGDGGVGLAVEVVSSRPEYVSGGDALVGVSLPDGVDAAEVTVEADGADVTDAFAPDPHDRARLLGLVDGLPEGDSEIVATAGDAAASVTVTNHPPTGPLFSGEQLELYACTTESFGLAPSTPDRGCVADTRVTWQYVDTTGARHDLADPTAPPADAATVEVAGGEVPFVLRTETGTLNRAVYTITALDPAPDPAGASVDASGWNRRLVYRFGGGCGVSFTQGFSLLDAPSLELLEAGYLTATATFNTFQVLCNDVISAETVSMVKEHVTETYGEPVHTIGEGGSGGAIQQLLIAQDYPGLLDAVAPLVPFPDALSVSGGVYDCALLTDYYVSSPGAALTPEQRAAINGHAVDDTCGLWDSTFASGINPSTGCRTDFSALGAGAAAPFPTIPPEEIYDPDTNPDGWRCTVWESNVAITGRDPDTGFARPGYDNEGVQYGLDALNAGVITPDQFVDLNAAIGGFDDDGLPSPERSVVPEELVRRAYETGRVTGPWGGLPDTPVILVNVYTDELGDIHDRVRSFSLIDRLSGGGEPPATVSLWSVGIPEGSGLLDTLTGALGDFAARPTLALDEWLTAAEAHQADEGGSWQDALAATKPAAAETRCQPAGADEVVGPDATDDPACEAAFPVHEEPRMAAGAPRSGDILKCALRPVEEATDLYEVELTDAHLDRLAEIFPTGVCDYREPSQGFVEFQETWYDFGAQRPGG
jgi:Tannase-like family of unknown function (DUF6351)